MSSPFFDRLQDLAETNLQTKVALYYYGQQGLGINPLHLTKSIDKFITVANNSEEVEVKQFLFAIVLIGILLASGCGETTSPASPPSDSPVTATEPKPEPELPPSPPPKKPEYPESDLLSTVAYGSVMTLCENWDADADDDGIVVYPSFHDANGEIVKFEGIELPVEIRIYDEDEKVLFYTGTGSIDSWEDGVLINQGYGIKVPFEDIDASTEYGVVYVTISLPDKRTFEAKEVFARISPK